MGQDISVEDLDAFRANQGLKLDEALEQLLSGTSKRINRPAPTGSPTYLFYTCHRTPHGAPTINPRSYDEVQLSQFEEENDGFPVAATRDEIHEFDRALLALTEKPRKQRRKQRSRSLTEVASLAASRLPALTRPKFVDKLIAGATSLAKKSQGKQKRYQQQLSQGETFESPNNLIFSDSVTGKNEKSERFPSSDLLAQDGDTRFCSQCGLQILLEHGRGEKYGREDWINGEAVCVVCQRQRCWRFSLDKELSVTEKKSERKTEDNESSAGGSALQDNEKSAKVFVKEHENISLSEIDREKEDVQNSNWINEKYSLGNKQCLSVFSPLFELQDTKEEDEYKQRSEGRNSISTEASVNFPRFEFEDQNKNDKHCLENSGVRTSQCVNEFPLSRFEFLDQKEKHENLNEAEDESKPGSDVTDNTADILGPNCPIIPGHVKRQLAALTQPSHCTQKPPVPSKKVQRSHSERVHLAATPPARTSHKRHLSPQADRDSGWVRGYYGPANDTFSQAVMAKGYVRALAEQINHQGTLRRCGDDDDDDDADHMDGGPGDGNRDMCMSTSSLTSSTFQEDEIPTGLVQCVVQAAERRKSQLGNGPLSSTEKDRYKMGHSLHVLVSDPPGIPSMSDRKLGPNPTAATNGDLAHASLKKKVPSTGGSDDVEHSADLPHDQTTKPEIKSPKPSPGCSPKPSPSRSGPHSPSQKPPQSPGKARSVKGSKPEVPPKKLSLTSHSLSVGSNLTPTSLPVLLTSSASSAVPLSPLAKNSPALSSTKSTSGHLSPATAAAPQSPSPCDTKSLTSSLSNIGEVCLRDSSRTKSQQYRDSVFNTIYDNAPPMNAAELFDSSWSDTDSYNGESDDLEEKEIDNKKEQHMPSSASSEAKVPENLEPEGPSDNKRFRIAEELLKTEQDYVARLHLLHQVFYFRLDKENRQHSFMPPLTLNQMFSNIKSIFLFHHDFLLPQLEDRMKNWENDYRIGDLMKKNAPFLKMYTEYIRNFDNAMKLINQWMEKSTRFSDIIQDIQKQAECGNLSLQHHMLGPIQRVPRYELLLKDYVKHLPEGSPDMNDAKDALDLVTKAACHSNEAMKKIETFHKLLDIYQSLRGVPVDFISPTREFVTQGPVTKIAARSGEKQLRQIFLFNDLVLVCTQYNLLGTYSVRSQLDVDSMEVKPGNNMHIPNTFLVHSKQKVVELLDENPSGESFGWQEKIKNVISQYRTRKRLIRHEESKEFILEPNVPDSCLGKTAPQWIPDDAATMCMLCEITFNMMRRRHHCRACGKLVCKNCCKKAPLEYREGKIERVCSVCYDIIVNKRGMNTSDTSVGENSPKKKGVLQVKASEPGLISGYLNCSEDSGHSWQKLWITAHKDFALYSFKAHEDVSAICSLPLPGHEVGQIWDIEGRQFVFGLCHKKKKICYYQTDNEKRLKRWMNMIGKLVQAELPNESSRLSSQSNSSSGSVASDSTTNNNNGSSSSENNNRCSTHSGSQADSGYPGDSNNSLAALAGDDSENADGISQYDNVDGVVSE